MLKGTEEDYLYIKDKLGYDELKNDLTLVAKCDNNKIIAGVVYSVIGKIVYLSIYSNSPKWCTKKNINQILGCPFELFDIKIVKAATSNRNKKSNKLLRGLNLREEGFIRFAREDGSHEVIYSITKKELKEKWWNNGWYS